MQTLRFYSEQLLASTDHHIDYYWVLRCSMIFQPLDNHTSIHGQKMTL